MNCKKCGELLDEHVKFCPVCGAQQVEDVHSEEITVLNPTHSHEDDCAHEGHVSGGQSVSFVDAVKLFFIRYTDFKGRSRRSEYWWVYLFNMIVSTLISIIIADLAWIWTLATIVPGIALCIRRLHDTGRSGWWALISLVPLAGPIILLVFVCQDSAPDNPWGPNPKA